MTDTSNQVESLSAARRARRGVGAAMAELAEALERGDGADLAPLVSRLSDAWESHVAITESGEGLLADIIEVAPNLAPRCATLRDEHAAIAAALAASPRHPADLHGVLADIDRHRHRGAELVYDAFNVDIAEAD